jgi:hypothetical protein
MKDLVKVKFNEFLSRFEIDSASVPYSKYNKHLLLVKLEVSSSKADPKTSLKIPFSDLKNEFFACVKEQLS